MFGTLEDVEGMKLKAWRTKQEENDTAETPEEELDDEERGDRSGAWFMGEEPEKPPLVVEKREVEVEIT